MKTLAPMATANITHSTIANQLNIKLLTKALCTSVLITQHHIQLSTQNYKTH